MKKLIQSLAAISFAALLGLAVAPAANAQSNMENSTFTITEPLDVGGVVLEPGTYMIKVVLLASNRNTIQITNEAQTKVFANVLATPHPIKVDEAIPASRYVYFPAIAGQPKALRTWFARETSNGQDIVYPKRRAMELAAALKEPVVATEDEVKETEYKTAPLTFVTPDRQTKPYVYVETPRPAAVVAENSLPRTGSSLPLLAAAGLLSIGAALALRAVANRMA